ncbi:FMRFamide receptor 1 [Plakobranchus ocellatus]|uniref:FMRFamide receptor 1 n=1 Tax=Plakobranchus ocellatus TaxID=259542 RepID=A0AAV4D2C5_9GAST|nr:FMRFamide receptor 1 [Plakobranchus ocellatus]
MPPSVVFMSTSTMAAEGVRCPPGKSCPKATGKETLTWGLDSSWATAVLPTSFGATSLKDGVLLKDNTSGTITLSDYNASYSRYNSNSISGWDTSGRGINASGNVTAVEEDISLSQGAEATLIVFYTLTILFSIVGNILVVIVFTRGRRCRTDIRPFLINLAASDLIMALFCMPFTFTYVMTRTWIFSEPMCPLVLFMQHLSVSASVFTNMAIGIDRFLVVTFPLKARMTSRRARYTICVIWVCAIGLSSVQLVVGRATTVAGVTNCDEVWSSQSSRRTFTMLILFITYIIPLVILSVTYSIVSRLLWKRTAPGNAHEGRDLQQLKAKRKQDDLRLSGLLLCYGIFDGARTPYRRFSAYLRADTLSIVSTSTFPSAIKPCSVRVIKMLVLVVIMFGACWLPLHTFFLVLDFKPELIRADTHLSTVVFYIAFLLAMSNSCANPIIYGFTNDSFRIDLATLCTIWFPFCVCLKRLANRKFSMSTYDSQYNRRFSTLRKGPVDSIHYRPAGGSGSGGRFAAGDFSPGDALGQNGSRMYIELRQGLLSKERSAQSVNDYYRDSLERAAVRKGVRFPSNGEFRPTNNNHSNNKVIYKDDSVGSRAGRPGIMKNSYSSNSLLREHLSQQSVGKFNTRPPHRLPVFLRSESGDSTKRLTSNRSHESKLGDLQFTSTSPVTGSDHTPQGSSESPADSPSSVAPGGFLFPKTATNGSATKLKCLPEDEHSHSDCNAL